MSTIETVSEESRRLGKAKVSAVAHAGGRPPLFDAATLTALASRKPGVTRRTLHDVHYADRAAAALVTADGQPDPAYAWLLSRGRRTLLAEVGRVKDVTQLKEYALWACEHKPAARYGAEVIRFHRLGRRHRHANGKRVAELMLEALNRYAIAHKLSVDALSTAASIVTKAIARTITEMNSN